MKIILNDRESYALIDQSQYERISKYTWHKDKGGYICRATRVNGKPRHILMHRELLGLKSGDPRQCDHINRIRHDNRLKNLRYATPEINALNRRGRGITWNRSASKWQVQIKHRYKSRYLGLFSDKTEALRIYRSAKKTLIAGLISEMSA